MKKFLITVKEFIIGLFLNNNDKGAEISSYSQMLGLNKSLTFKPTKEKVANQTEFNTIVRDAEFMLAQDCSRLGLDYEIIPPAYKNGLDLLMGSMTIVADNDGKVDIRFHKRDKKLWDGVSEIFPEKNTTGKFKHEIIFVLEEKD